MVDHLERLSEFSGKRILVTGHTGFKGAWLSLELESLGAEVMGLSLPPAEESLYVRAGMAGRWNEWFVDIRDREQLRVAFRQAKPELVFHMAAQPIVSVGYHDPVMTFETNTMGTAYILEEVRQSPYVIGCVIITTDKVYRPQQEAHRHVESDPLGGDDPYAASKAGAEHVIASWQRMLLATGGPKVVSARAGNVIGGGDSAENRLLPDLVRAFSAGEPALIRHPSFTRPWQHVLDPLAGYLLVGSGMLLGRDLPAAINFGPDHEYPVRHVADLAVEAWGEPAEWRLGASLAVHETPLLALDSSLAHHSLGWTPTWDTNEAVMRTIRWWQRLQNGDDPLELCLQDIRDFARSLRHA